MASDALQSIVLHSLIIPGLHAAAIQGDLGDKRTAVCPCPAQMILFWKGRPGDPQDETVFYI